MKTEHEREQLLIDMMFEVAQVSALYWASSTRYDRVRHMDWVADQLEAAGFATKTIGSSWGVITGETEPVDASSELIRVTAQKNFLCALLTRFLEASGNDPTLKKAYEDIFSFVEFNPRGGANTA